MTARKLISVVLPAAALFASAWLLTGQGLGQGVAATKPATPPTVSVPSSTAASAPSSAPASRPATASAPSARAVHVFVSGKVQGVGFRDWTVKEARGLKLTGWVRNLTDGRVEAVIEGPSPSVATLLEKLKTGPATAQVTDVKPTDQAPTGEFKDFQQR
jgi:acylphosphatase